MNFDCRIWCLGAATLDLDGEGPDQALGNLDAFVVKYSASGAFVWARQFGTSGQDTAYWVDVDSAGNVYVAGESDSDLDGTGPQEASGLRDAFLLKMDAAGNELWMRQFGTDEVDTAFAMTVDSHDEVVVVGGMSGDEDQEGPEEHFGAMDIYVAKYAGDGTRIWLRQLGTTLNEAANSVAVDVNDDIVIVGQVSTDLDADEAGEFFGGVDAFVVKLSSDGDVQWLRQLGTELVESLAYVATDSAANILVTFYTMGDIDGAGPEAWVGDRDVALVKLDPLGTAIWTLQLGTTGADTALSIATDVEDAVWLGGRTYGLFEEAGNASEGLAFLTRIASDGTVQWLRQFGASEYDEVGALAPDALGNMVVFGTTVGGPLGDDSFIAKYNRAGNP